jgi:hypothetical protein
VRINKTSIAFGVAMVAAAGFALANSNEASHAIAPTPAGEAQPAPAAVHGAEVGAPPIDDETATLPPNHPPIDGVAASPHGGAAAGGSPHGHDGIAPSADPPSLAWKADAGWKSVPNPSSMRLATYSVPRAPGDSTDAELSIMRAGGDTEANISRWASQFDGSPAPQRKDLTAHGVKATIVSFEGTYSGGMGPAAGTHPDWAMLGAIVEAPGQPYFFKLTGPKATVKAARAKFEAMIASVDKT